MKVARVIVNSLTRIYRMERMNADKKTVQIRFG